MKTPPLIPAWLMIATVIAIAAAILVTSGCATYPQELQAHEERHCDGWSHTGQAPFYTWHKAREAAPKPWLYVRAVDPDSACRSMAAFERGAINACAVWRRDSCIIILPEGVP